MNKKIAIFAHYDKDNKLKDYVIYYLAQLTSVCDNIVFVTTSKILDSDKFKLQKYCTEIIERENIGHDFFSYKAGIEVIYNLENIEQLILCNDSCFGPLFSLNEVFGEMNSRSCDFWGISAMGRPHIHLQSYFLVFNQLVINSKLFKDFWFNLQILTNKDDIVANYEVGLSQLLINSKFRWSSLIPHDSYKISCSDLLTRKSNIVIREACNENSRFSVKTIFEPLNRVDKTISLFDYSIKMYKFPFLKKSLLSDKWISKDEIYDIIKSHTGYDINLIKDVVNA